MRQDVSLEAPRRPLTIGSSNYPVKYNHQEKSIFFKLPPELRMQVYMFALGGTVIDAKMQSHGTARPKEPSSGALVFLQTRRLV